MLEFYKDHFYSKKQVLQGSQDQNKDRKRSILIIITNHSIQKIIHINKDSLKNKEKNFIQYKVKT